jgi:hypothetical protein
MQGDSVSVVAGCSSLVEIPGADSPSEIEKRKKIMKSFKQLAAVAAIGLVFGNAYAAGDAGVEPTTQSFLQALEAGGGKPWNSSRRRMHVPCWWAHKPA